MLISACTEQMPSAARATDATNGASCYKPLLDRPVRPVNLAAMSCQNICPASQGYQIFEALSGVLQEAPEYMGLDEYDALVFRVMGDGRKYIANIRTDNWIVGGQSHDVWQAFLFARSAQQSPISMPFISTFSNMYQMDV